MRKLASIKTISDLIPIENKDRIELAIIDGWQVIVKKGEYQKGDKTVFVEIDSVLPNKPEFEFLSKNEFRIKTMKMSGVLSQGICFPLSILPQDREYEVDQDVTSIIGIKQYEQTIDTDPTTTKELDEKYQRPIYQFLFKFEWIRKLLLSNKQTEEFPSFISKTDEIRIQNIPHIMSNKDIKYIVREKIDGQSGTFFLKRMRKKYFWQRDSFDFGVCSRNLRLWDETDSSYWFVAKKYSIKMVLMSLIGDHDFVAIQGECVAPNVQGNKYGVTEPDLYAFNLIYPTGNVLCIEGENILKEYGIKWCPLVCENYTLPDSVNELLEYATGKSALKDTLREGVVLRNYEKAISFKAVSPNFLLKHNE